MRSIPSSIGLCKELLLFKSMAVHTLQVFSQAAGATSVPYALAAGINFDASNAKCSLEFQLTGNLEAIELPSAPPPFGKRNLLWEHTCFELFLRAGNGSYFEWNFSPSGNWGFFAFTGYRSANPSYTSFGGAVDSLHFTATNNQANMRATLWLGFSEFLKSSMQCGFPIIGQISAVIKSKGQLNYWALEHAAAKADFHSLANFRAL